MTFIITCIAFCTIFSLGLAMRRDLKLYCALGLLILFSLAGVNLKRPSTKSLCTLSNHSVLILSRVSFVNPGVMLPGLLLIRK